MGVSVEWIIQTVIMLVIGIIGFFIKQSLNSMESKINKNNDRIDEVYKQLSEYIDEKMKHVDELQKDFQCFKEKVVDEFARKSELNRVTGEIMNKLEKIFDILMSLKTGNKQG